MDGVMMAIAIFSLLIWLFLLGFWGNFWRSDQQIEPDLLQKHPLAAYPSVRAIVPARNEADVLPQSLKSLLTQNYPGDFGIILIDDQSQDGTAAVARSLAIELGKELDKELGKSDRLVIISGQPLPPGWSGKLWAMEQGIRWLDLQTTPPDYLWLTDADIKHHPSNLLELVTQSEQNNLDLASLMVKLRCESFWERFLIPSFVFFFEKLYPFPWVNDPQRKNAAAAGGCILLRRDALERIGGLDAIRQTLIDDCSLALQIKATSPLNSSSPKRGIWLGLTQNVQSLRAYDSLASIWSMVARTAYTQLSYSPGLLLGTVVAMTLIYLVAPGAAIAGLIWQNLALTLLGAATWVLMAIAYYPTVKLYRQSPLWALTLPAIAFLYTLMTLDSAWRHWRGQGGHWKGRVYAIPAED
jgi:hopene-associated glycosyltransferase HpnB